MSWATPYVARLVRGETVTLRPRGQSMAPLIKTGQEVTVRPVASDELQAGDLVLCRVRGQYYLHLIKAVQGNRYLIGNNRGHINGWVSRPAIFGRRVK
jgi:cell wall-associated NlpC family hydrolase